jgi:phosphoglycerate dehydrogenase-like enzyme
VSTSQAVPSQPGAGAETTIVYSPPPVPEVLAIAHQYLPAGFRLEVVEPRDLPEALQEAEYLLGFIGYLPDGALLGTRRLKLVQLMSAGYDRFNLEAARAGRIPVATNGGANAIAVAEHAIMLMLATLKHLSELDRTVRAGHWRQGRTGELRLHELWHATVGIVGMGRIGQQVARRLRGWEASLVYYDPLRLPAETERELGVRYLPLEELAAAAQVITIHVPLSKRTQHLFDEELIGRMAPGAVLVNTARGELVDETALVAALRDGRLGGAGLDVFAQEPPPADHPLFALPNVVLTPHAAGPTWESWPRRFANGYANIARVHRGEAPQWVVPELAP